MSSERTTHSDARPVRGPGPGRRSLLKAAGAMALGVPLAAGGAKSAYADEAPVDVIIVGAGYAGGTVARELSAAGMRTVVLEARNRIGGRIWTGTFAGERVEIGGGWLGPEHHHVLNEFRRYGLTTVQDVAATRMVMPTANGYEEVDPAAASAELSALNLRLYEGSEQYFERPAEPLYRRDLLEEVDKLSMADRIGQLGLDPVRYQWLNGSAVLYSGGPSTRGALTSMAQWERLAAGRPELTTSLKPAQGMTALLQAMLDESKALVRLNSPVTRIVQQSRMVTVEVAGARRYLAPVVVVAIPTNMWKTITFEPGLPQAHADATTEGIGVPHGTKIWMRVSGDTDAVYAQGDERAALLQIVPQQQLPDGSRLVIGFSGPSLNVSDRAQVEAALRAFLPKAKLVDYRVKDWGRDPYSRGAWGMRRPGQLLRQLPAVQQPHQRVVFAGGDIASGWHGAFIDGAIESGLLAARQVTTLLG
ncbi:FAD-dependent oxidoreductase [Streptomyces spinoverrucosus]|uniref:flavin monoamine oxidase family protein n=1 Tax=Streptomyces spinoverrucosus TaxID=284043 RepID=UPI0018C3D138|nr:NAD(P)/FAD-dependent oxidoreductase [Streptomyces spinoverrucosus]MBG0856953.1 FAD-dependent oxidoreductase [Streptomyces spinoverrucosus]